MSSHLIAPKVKTYCYLKLRNSLSSLMHKAKNLLTPKAKYAKSFIIILILFTIYPTTALTADFIIPPDVAGDLEGTNDNDNITIDAGGGVLGFINGRQGSDRIENQGQVGDDIYGILNNTSVFSGFNRIINGGVVMGDVYGSLNLVDNSSGGGNTITNQSGGIIDGSILGSYNIGLYSASVHGNTVTNSGTVDDLLGSSNEGDYSSGGGHTVTNNFRAMGIWGSENYGKYSSGGSNTIINDTSEIVFGIWGSENSGEHSQGGGNTITNDAPVFLFLYGSDNSGDYSSGGENNITNQGVVNNELMGSYNFGQYSSGGGNIITNNGFVIGVIIGSFNAGLGSSGGSNKIYNYGYVQDYDIYGSYNDAAGTSGGSNTIYNHNYIDGYLTGTYNAGDGSSGGDNIIYNYGEVWLDIEGTSNDVATGTGGGNQIFNYGTVYGSIYGTHNVVAGSSSGGTGNTITNNGTVKGGIYAGDADDTVHIQANSQVDGVVDGQQGADRLYLGLAGTLSLSQYNLKYLNFEQLGLDITSVTTLLGGPWTFDLGVIIHDTGTLTMDQAFTSSTVTNQGTATFSGNATVTGGLTNTGALTTFAELNTTSLDNSGTANLNGHTICTVSLTNTGTINGNTLLNSGTATLSGDTTFTGGITNSGTFTNTGTLSGNSLDNTGTVNLDGNTTFTGEITNSGSLGNTGNLNGTTLVNYGTANLSGTSTFTGGITNSNYLTNTGTLSANSLGNSGTASLGGVATFTGNIANRGTLIASGRLSASNLINQGKAFITGTLYAGSLTNTGYTSISGTANISRNTTNSGTLNVNGNLNTGSLVNTGSLSGTGVIRSQINNQGTISPGNSIGTLSVVNSVTFEPGSILQAELASDYSCDLLKVTGTVTINHGTISTRIPQVLYENGASWSIITATNGINGIFDNIDDQINSQVLSLTQGADNSALRLVINRKSYGDFASGGAAETGRNLDTLVPFARGEMADLLLTMDFDLDADQIGRILNTLSPEMYTAFTAASLKAGGLFDQSISGRLEELALRQAFSLKPNQAENSPIQLADAGTIALPTMGQTPRQGWSFWGKGLGLWADKDETDGYLDRSQTTGGASLGADYMLTNRLLIGLAAGATSTDLSWNKSDYQGDINAIHTGFYTQASLEDFFARFVASYARLTSNAKRPVDFPGMTNTTENDFEADLYSAGLALGYQARFGAWLLEPLAGLNYQHLNEEGFTEKGAGLLNLDIATRETDSLHSNLGLKLSRLCRFNNWEILPSLQISWQHRFSDERPSLDANFTDYASNPFTVHGADFNDNTAIANLGLTASLTQSFLFFADYRLAMADNYQDQALSAGLMVRF